MKRASSRKPDLVAARRISLAGIILVFFVAAATFAAPLLFAAADQKDGKGKAAASSKVLKGLPVEALTEDEAILQALNRLGFGPRPGDLERVKEMGLQKWIDRQLHPDSMNDSALGARLERFPTLKMSSAKLLEEFPEPQIAARREGITVEEYRKEQMEQMRAGMRSSPQGETQNEPGMQPTGATQGPAPSDVQMADAMHMPDFEGVDNDLNANPAKGNGQEKRQGGSATA